MDELDKIIAENKRRLDEFKAPFNPVTGFGSIGERTLLNIPDYPIPEVWMPDTALKNKLLKKVIACGSIKAYIDKHLKGVDKEYVVDAITRVRCQYDFAFWAYTYVRIKNKQGGEDIPFLLNRPQRRCALGVNQSALFCLNPGNGVVQLVFRCISLGCR